MTIWQGALCGVALLALAGAAEAGEPIVLDHADLDRVTAGANVGAIVLAGVEIGGVAIVDSDFRNTTGPLAAGVLFQLGNDGGAAEIAGDVTVTEGPLFDTALGIFSGATETEGNASAGIRADPIFAPGAVILIDKVGRVDFGNQSLFITMGATLN